MISYMISYSVRFQSSRGVIELHLQLLQVAAATRNSFKLQLQLRVPQVAAWTRSIMAAASIGGWCHFPADSDG